MSYILEALKKAQAERQLGALPTIHAPTLDGGAGSAAISPLKRPLVLALGAMGVVIVALLALVWRQPAQPDAAPLAKAAAPAPAPLATAPVPAPVPAMVPAPAPAEPQATAPAAKKVAPAPAPRIAKTKPPAPEHAAVTAPAMAEAPSPALAKTAAAPQDESAPPLRDLPEPIQRSVPTIAMGGYMYSKNPADRLLLIDKVLRHEGEEVAPGLVLEKLQPKAAVFSFKGYRYRVPY